MDIASEDMEDCGSQSSTRSYSVGSGVTIDSCWSRTDDPWSHEGEVKMENVMGWTNEKHNSYLDSLERSFVKQLRHSIGLHKRQAEGRLWEPFLTTERLVNTCNSANLNNNVETKGTSMEGERTHDILENPWIRRLTSDNQTAEPVLQQKVADRDEDKNGWSINFLAEVIGNEASDQNFAGRDEDEKANIASSAKRARRAGTADAISSDQIVPRRKLPKVDNSDVSHRFSLRGTEGLLSELPDGFASKNANLHYYLKGC